MNMRQIRKLKGAILPPTIALNYRLFFNVESLSAKFSAVGLSIDYLFTSPCGKLLTATTPSHLR